MHRTLNFCCLWSFLWANCSGAGIKIGFLAHLTHGHGHSSIVAPVTPKSVSPKIGPARLILAKNLSKPVPLDHFFAAKIGSVVWHAVCNKSIGLIWTKIVHRRKVERNLNNNVVFPAIEMLERTPYYASGVTGGNIGYVLILALMIMIY